MKIQLLQDSPNYIFDQCDINTFSSPFSPDLYDLTIIDLSSRNIWTCGESDSQLRYKNDFENIEKMLLNYPGKKYLFILPQDITYFYNYSERYQKYISSFELKNNILGTKNLLHDSFKVLDTAKYSLVYEPNLSLLGDEEIESRFVFKKNSCNGCISTVNNNYYSCIEISKNIFVTTLFVNNQWVLGKILEEIFKDNEKECLPDWAEDYSFYNSASLKEKIKTNSEKQKSLIEELKKLNEQVCKNNHYKLVLTETGDKLVSVVFEMLEMMLEIDLKSFIDEHEADFIFDCLNWTLVGEIKGVSSNVRRDNISQTVYHKDRYISDCQDKNLAIDKTKILPILIINRERDIPINDRHNIDAELIEYARSNDVRVLDSQNLLKLFENFLLRNIAKEEVMQFILNKGKGGLLLYDDFEEKTN